MFKGKSVKGGKGTEFSKKYSLANTILGKGAYGKVMLGFTVKTKEKVAVKVMDKTNMLKTDHAKLYKEVNILKLLHHKNVVCVFDFYDEPEEFKIVMEYVDGGELFDKIVDDDVKFTEQQSMEYIRVIAGALKYCKEQGVIHRDIKPENILLTKEGDIKIADFNLSKQVDKESLNFSLLQTMCGTPNYVAPEVLSGKPYDYKCDIWSLGVISFLLLSGGYLPFFINPKTEGRDELLAKVKAGKWKFSPEKAWTNVSEKAKDFMTRVLVKNPKKRLTYEQLLAHPWFKISGESLDELKAVRIDMSNMMKLNEKRRMLAASYYQTAADTFADMMGPAASDNDAVVISSVVKDAIGESGEDIFDTEFD